MGGLELDMKAIHEAIDLDMKAMHDNLSGQLDSRIDQLGIVERQNMERRIEVEVKAMHEVIHDACCSFFEKIRLSDALDPELDNLRDYLKKSMDEAKLECFSKCGDCEERMKAMCEALMLWLDSLAGESNSSVM